MISPRWTRVALLGGVIAGTCALLYCYQDQILASYKTKKNDDDEEEKNEQDNREGSRPEIGLLHKTSIESNDFNEQHQNQELQELLDNQSQEAKRHDAISDPSDKGSMEIQSNAEPTTSAGNSREEALDILRRVAKSQNAMKEIMKELIKSFAHENLPTLHDAYLRVQTCHSEDPLEASGLSVEEFDQMLTRYQNDAEITQIVTNIMGMGPSMRSSPASSNAEDLSVSQILEAHQFMLKQVRDLLDQMEAFTPSENYDTKTLTLAIQALIGARVEKDLGLNSSDLEAAILRHHEVLESNPEFIQLNLTIQSLISQLIERTSHPDTTG